LSSTDTTEHPEKKTTIGYGEEEKEERGGKVKRGKGIRCEI